MGRLFVYLVDRTMIRKVSTCAARNVSYSWLSIVVSADYRDCAGSGVQKDEWMSVICDIIDVVVAVMLRRRNASDMSGQAFSEAPTGWG